MSELRAHVPRSPDDGLAQLERLRLSMKFFDKALLGFLNHIRRAAVVSDCGVWLVVLVS